MTKNQYPVFVSGEDSILKHPSEELEVGGRACRLLVIGYIETKYIFSIYILYFVFVFGEDSILKHPSEELEVGGRARRWSSTASRSPTGKV